MRRFADSSPAGARLINGYTSRALINGEMLKYGRLIGLSDLPSSHAWHLMPFVVGQARNRFSPAELQLPRGWIPS
jgi:hypothetical protein